MRIAVLGGGPGGLLAALLAKRGDPAREVTVFERNRAGDTFGFGVVFSDATLDGIDAADPVLRRALTEHGVHWDPIEVRLRGERWRFGGNGMAAVARRTLLTLLQQRAAEAGVDLRFSAPVHPDDLLSRRRRIRPGGRGRRGELADAGAVRRRVRPERGDRHGQVHLVRHHVPVQRADLRARAGPARRVRGARLPDRERRLDVHRGDRRTLLARGGPRRVRRRASRPGPATRSPRPTWKSSSRPRSTAARCW